MSVLNTIRFVTGHPLNRGRKLAALARFLKWQLGSRLVSGTIVYEWVHGSKFFVKTGETGLTGNIYTGLHEYHEMGFLLHFLRSKDLFVDVGANVGSYTILAGFVIGARVLAFEPIQSTHHRLLENVRLNHLEERVECVNKAVGAKKETAEFTSDQDTTNHALAPGEQCDSKVIIETVPLDSALRGEVPLLMKIDVEGLEAQVLEGALQSLKNPDLKVVIMELNGSGERYGFDETRTVQMMLDHGFQAYSYAPFERRLVELQPKKRDPGNTLFIRDKSFVLNRLRTAPKVTVHGRTF